MKNISSVGNYDLNQNNDNYDPEPLSIILEIANLIIQPGSLALLAAGTGVALQYKSYKKISDNQKSKIRGKLYEIDRALNDGFNVLMLLASLIDQFNYLEHEKMIGDSPIKGFKNSQKLRRAHEDCRSAVKDARDAFIDLSGLLPGDHSEQIQETLRKINKLYQPLVSIETNYAQSLIVGTFALHTLDNFICNIGENYDFKRSARSFTDDLLNSVTRIRFFHAEMQERYK